VTQKVKKLAILLSKKGKGFVIWFIGHIAAAKQVEGNDCVDAQYHVMIE
jgi:hypothetical protein